MNKKNLCLTLALLVSYSPSLTAVPKNVIIIRHGEKIPGENHLDLKGFERANALSYYFSRTPLYNDPTITHIFATGLSETDSSVRPIQTCTPTANYYKLPLNIDFKVDETNELAQELLTNSKYNDTTVLVCWSHGYVRSIISALGAKDPGAWDDRVYDQVYMVTFKPNNKPILNIILQKLMFGDRATFKDSPPPLPPPTTKRVDEDS
ncbi:MAG: histidine phosphatase family protein [Alphaproteobacteria bacterium]|nr:histidine phosphatase family protein [Alphaproteobacteria bacterium]